MSFGLTQLKEFSAKIGKDSNLVQSSGGNTSIKENGILWVKASGKQLKDALEEDIFVGLDLQSTRSKFLYAKKEEECKFDNLCGSNLKASIETSLHALMPHKVVIHTHPTDVIACSILKNGKNFVEKSLNGISWKWIPYRRPGKPLSDEILKTIGKEIPNVLILANHGLVIGEESIEKAENLQIKVISLLKQSLRKFNRPDLASLKEIAYKIPGAKLPIKEIIHSLGNDYFSFKLANNLPPYPDHVVFCGKKPWIIEDLYIPSNKVKYGIIKGLGVIILEKESKVLEEMLAAQSEIFLRISLDAKINFLTEKDCDNLINWEAEKYRQRMNKINFI